VDSTLARIGATVVSVDSEDAANGNVAANAIDGDPETIWHTRWTPENDPMPHRIVIDLGRTMTLRGITYLPRQDLANARVGECEVFLSADGRHWGDPVARGRFENTDQRQTLSFVAPSVGRFLEIVIRSEVTGAPFAAAAELDVVE
jgi:phospholipase C